MNILIEMIHLEKRNFWKYKWHVVVTIHLNNVEDETNLDFLL